MLHFQLPRLFSFEKALRTRSRHNVNLAYALHAPASISRSTHMRRNRTGSHRDRRFPSSRVSHTREHPHMEFPRERGPQTTFQSGVQLNQHARTTAHRTLHNLQLEQDKKVHYD
jgi:hypothetical protein